MPTAFEEVTLGYKIASLAVEIGRFAANNLKSWSGDTRYRITSSLTTLEFTYDGQDQITHFVQDRTVKILKDKTSMPPFRYGTDGEDIIEQLTIGTREKPPAHYTPRKKKEKDGIATVIVTEEDLEFLKGDLIRCVLTARSINGNMNPKEWYSSVVYDLMDSFTIFIIFPTNKLPTEIQALIRKPPFGNWTPVRDKNELRQFTGRRKAFILEGKSAPLNHEYQVAWTW